MNLTFKSARSHFKESGFTLIELIIVIGLVATLSTMATVNFRRFVYKARQAEVKLKLGGIYTALEVFYSDTGTYTLCLGSIGVEFPKIANNYYRVGFTWNLPVQQTCGPNGTSSCLGMNWDSGSGVTELCGWGPGVGEDSVVFEANSNLLADCQIYPSSIRSWDPRIPANVLDYQTYLVGSSGSLKGDANCDKWSIDQMKRLRNVHSGL